MPWRNVAAAAKGPMTTLTNVSAHRIVNGVSNGIGPTTAALVAATPKISTGMVSGSTRTGSSRPPRPTRRHPMGGCFGRHHHFERRPRHQDQIERSVLMVGGEQPIEGEERGEQ